MLKTNKAATITALLIVVCILPDATGNKLGDVQTFKTVTEPVSSEPPVAVPVAFLALSRGFNSERSRISIEMPAGAPGTYSAAPIWRGTIAHPNRSNAPSAVPAAFSSLPRSPEANVDRISFDAHALAPMAFVRFCMRYPRDCKVYGMPFRPKPVELTKARRAELLMVNREVNRAIRPQENVNGVMAEEWLVSPRAGDCNDYAVTKRHKLLTRGWPSRSLLLAEVVVPSGEHHLVLVVRTREDDFVLDNLNSNVRSVSQVQYEWVRAQETENPKYWSTVSIKRAAQVAMNTR